MSDSLLEDEELLQGARQQSSQLEKRSMLVMCCRDILPSASDNPVFVPVVETSNLLKP